MRCEQINIFFDRHPSHCTQNGISSLFAICQSYGRMFDIVMSCLSSSTSSVKQPKLPPQQEEEEIGNQETLQPPGRQPLRSRNHSRYVERASSSRYIVRRCLRRSLGLLRTRCLGRTPSNTARHYRCWRHLCRLGRLRRLRRLRLRFGAGCRRLRLGVRVFLSR